MMQTFKNSRWLLGAFLGLVVAGPALAVDGVLEINQNCAVNTGCFSGDAPDFPVTLPQQGTYRLTSNLEVTGNKQGIDATPTTLDDVTIDLNGFTLEGDGENNGIQLFAGDNWEVRNGTVRNFNNGIQQAASSNGHRIIDVRLIDNANSGMIMSSGEGHMVKGCTFRGNGAGFSIGGKSLAIGNVVVGNTGTGMSLGGGSGYGDNVISNNGGTVSGGFEISGNICDGNTSCP